MSREDLSSTDFITSSLCFITNQLLSFFLDADTIRMQCPDVELKEERECTSLRRHQV